MVDTCPVCDEPADYLSRYVWDRHLQLDRTCSKKKCWCGQHVQLRYGFIWWYDHVREAGGVVAHFLTHRLEV